MKDTIRIGVPIPLSGGYGKEAEEQRLGAQLAVQEFNLQGGWLGREAELLVRDTKLQNDLAISATEELVKKEKVNFVVGALSSIDQIGISNVCKKNGVIYNAISQSDSILYTENRSPWTFHEGPNPHMTSGSAGRYAFSHFGNRVGFLSVDTEYGQHSKRALRHVGDQIGVQVVADLEYELGARDFRKHLEQIAAQKPEVLAFNNFGLEQLLCVEQAKKMGLADEMQIVCPNLSITQRGAGGADLWKGVIGTMAYFWRLEDTFASAKKFNQAYRNLSGGIPPTGYSTFAYNAIKAILSSVLEAKSLESDLVRDWMLGLRYDFSKGPQFYRQLDRQAIQCVLVVESKIQSEMEDPFDYFNILEVDEFLGQRAFLISRETQ
jgi:branched-chain amino acid transport system substrate-binding protein